MTQTKRPKTTKQTPAAETTVYLIRDIDADLWRRVKVTAAQRGTTIKDAITAMLVDFTKSGAH